MLIDVELHGATILRLYSVVVDDTGERSHRIGDPPHQLDLRMNKVAPLLVLTAAEIDDAERTTRWYQLLVQLSSEWRWLESPWSRTRRRWNCRLRLRSA